MRPDVLCINVHCDEDPRPEPIPCADCVEAAKLYPPEPPIPTEVVDGLEFEVSTWAKIPVPWNESGYWVKDPELEARLVAENLEKIRVVHPDLHWLLQLAHTAQPQAAGRAAYCRTYWGSHGCSLEYGHKGLCVCGSPGDLCSAGLKWGEGNTFVAWWCYGGDDHLTGPSYLHWTWYS